ncbi:MULTISPECIES: hypothetical protein [Pseudoalteromonas]|uniref:Apea-like HEPN domain-containing protein n=1 Tax=Pseudoalteromonas amylolytica TaxID=1859457 RepID=A0A1S1N1E9_9GAMM|nr:MULTISPECIES: hypothetical protein [Pseudoalteromonas]OHU91845.1 hypothetical protein BFC16_02470 [Pseudoalteromonas sp. JW3]OHU93171.1 hypothetical protein BET10_02380 [Pseudoalteromonas amylolytica]
MRIFDSINRDVEKHQLFFIECWASLSNLNTLDSDRVSYNNVLNSIEEMLDLYALGDKYKAPDKRKHVARELEGFLQNDPIIKKSVFNNIPQQLAETLTSHDNPLENKRSLIVSFLQELRNLINTHYRNESTSELSALLSDESEFNDSLLRDIYISANSLMSVLITQGMPISECYLLCRNYLMKRKDTVTFGDAIEGFFSKLKLPYGQYEVTLKLDDKKLYELIGRTSVKSLGDCHFSTVPRTEEERRYYVSAKIKVHAISFSSAIAASEKILFQAIDLFSYFLGKREIKILSKAEVVSSSNGDSKQLPRFEKELANILERWSDDELSDYMEVIGHFRQMGSEKTANKVHSTFKFFQNGVTEKSLESRFTAFWSALESLTLINENSKQTHDEHVIAAVIPCIALDYPVKQLSALKGCAKTLNWDNFNFDGAPFKIQDADLSSIYKALKTEDFAEQIKSSLSDHPYAQYRFMQFINLCSNPYELSNKVDAHRDKVELHIHRIYRIRNAIVHNASSHERLQLLVVNLEHYLRSTLNALVYTVIRSKAILSPEEAFVRYQHSANRVFIEMDPSKLYSGKKKEGKIKEIINGNVTVSDNQLIAWLSLYRR